jgi:hypothetical protein
MVECLIVCGKDGAGYLFYPLKPISVALPRAVGFYH